MRRSTTLRKVAAAAPVVAAALLFQVSAASAAIFKASPCDVPGMRELLLQQVNAARARGAVCGSDRFAAAAPVSWNDRLQAAAAGHSRDMAENNYFSHTSLRGTDAGARAEAMGYRWSSVGENIAAGDTYTAQNVVAGWMASPHHCSNIMDTDFSEVGIACVRSGGSTYGSYWTMVLGRSQAQAAARRRT